MKQAEELKEQIEALENQRVAIHKKLNQLKPQIYRLETEPAVKKLIGQCFKYRNSYGSGRKDWWLYSKVLGYNPRNQQLIICSYQRTSLEIIEIRVREERFCIDALKDHLLQTPVTSKQFDAVLNRATKELEKMKAKQ